MTKVMKDFYKISIVNKIKRWFKYNRPPYATSEEWEEFYIKFRKNAPVRYFVFIFFPRKVWWKVKHKYEHIVDWFRYRIFPRYWYHIVNTGLTPGYHEAETRMLHSCFSLLEDFVEIQKGWRELADPENNKKYPGYFARVFGKQRFPEEGISYLKWEITLGDDPKAINYSPSQAASAREILDLYLWWKARPNRIYTEIIYLPKGFRRSRSAYKSSPEFIAYDASCKAREAEDIIYQKEDDDNLIRLIRIREAMWT